MVFLNYNNLFQMKEIDFNRKTNGLQQKNVAINVLPVGWNNVIYVKPVPGR